MTRTTFIATCPDGTIVERTSATKNYTHVVVGRRVSAPAGAVAALAWCSRADLAAKQVAGLRQYFADVAILPATVKPKAVRKSRALVAPADLFDTLVEERLPVDYARAAFQMAACAALNQIEKDGGNSSDAFWAAVGKSASPDQIELASKTLDAAEAAAPIAQHATREAWLHAFTEAAKPVFEAAGAPIPSKVRMAVGFTSKGAKGKRIGECWSDVASGDGTFEIFIVPSLADPARVADILTHELIHAAVGLEAGHGKGFKKIATKLGLEGKMTATVAGPAWFTWAQPILDVLGPLPHAELGRGSLSSAPKQQKGRNMKVVCDTCGFTFRAAQKWIDAAPDGLRCPDAECDGSAHQEG